MNFFDRIKQNLKHGGVTVTIKAAQSISRQDLAMPVSITLTNGSKGACTIKLVTAEIQATQNKSGFEMSLNNAVQTTNTTDSSEMYSMQTIIVATANSTDVLVLQPSESKTITLNLVVSSKAPEQLKGGDYKYELHVKANVEGVSLNPQAHQSLQIKN